MDTLLVDYEEFQDYGYFTNNENIKDESREGFPELWEVEMEVLQVENSLDRSEKVNSYINKNEVLLEDYVDSEEEEGKTELNQKECNYESHNHQESFPTMWELELEILNSDQSITQNISAEMLKNRKSEISALSMSKSAMPFINADSDCFADKEDIRETNCMFDQLNISNGEEIISPMKGDVQNIFSNLSIA